MSLIIGDRIVLEYTPPKPGKESKRPRREKNAAAAKINAGAILSGKIVETNPMFVVLELPEGKRLKPLELASGAKLS